MKRFLVMDLFYRDKINLVEGEWNEVDKILPNIERCKVKIVKDDLSEMYAYFCADKGIPFGERCFFWDCISKEPIYNVLKWKALRDDITT